MNDIQKELLEIAKEYIRICEKLNLRYFTLGGTTLGAARHQGFIPWDDDMDFCMPRNDYNIFIKECQKHLASNFFLSSPETEKNYFLPFAKLRNSNTTAIENVFKDEKINHGLWIDVFPLDGLPKTFKKRKYYNWLDEKIFRRRFMVRKYKSDIFHIKVCNFLVKILIPSKKWAYKLSKHIAEKYDFDKSEFVFWSWHKRIKNNFKREWFDDFQIMKFEGVDMKVPVGWNEYLTEHYGDWRKLPPEEDRKTFHSFYILDLTKSYKTYMKEEK